MITIQPFSSLIDVDQFAQFVEHQNKFGVVWAVSVVFPDSIPLRDVAGVDWFVDGQTLVIRPPYSWDGPSGPTFDTPALRVASLVHDVICEPTPRGYAVASYYQRHLVYYLLARAQGCPRWRSALHFGFLLAFNGIYSAIKAR